MQMEQGSTKSLPHGPAALALPQARGAMGNSSGAAPAERPDPRRANRPRAAEGGVSCVCGAKGMHVQLCMGILCQGTQRCSTQEQLQALLAGTAGLPTHSPPQPSHPMPLQSTQRVTVTSTTSQGHGEVGARAAGEGTEGGCPQDGSLGTGANGQ